MTSFLREDNVRKTSDVKREEAWKSSDLGEGGGYWKNAETQVVSVCRGDVFFVVVGGGGQFCFWRRETLVMVGVGSEGRGVQQMSV